MNDKAHHGLLKHSAILFAATQVANACNLLFHVVMGRALPPLEYGVLSTMLGIMLTIGTPLEALRTSIAHFTARYVQDGQPGAVASLMKTWCWRMTRIAAPVVIVGLLASPFLTRFFHLESSLPIVMTSLILATLVYVPLLGGALQGLQAFLWMVLALQGMSVIRLLSGIALVYGVTQTSVAGIAAQAIGIAVALFFGAWGLRCLLKSAKRTEAATTGVGAYFFRSLLMLGGFAVLMNVDIILVRHYLPDESGIFARAATIGRSIIFLPMPIALAMFPKVISTGAMSGHSRRTLLKAVAMVTLIIGSGIAICVLLPWLPLLIIYNDHSAESASLVRVVVCAMAPLGLTYLLMNFEMAQHRFKSTLALIVCAAAYLAGVAVWHANVMQIIAVLAVVSVASAAVFLFNLPWRERGKDMDVSTPASQ